MIQTQLRLVDPARSGQFFGQLLRGFYDDLLQQGVPEHLARLVNKIDPEEPRAAGGGRRLAIVVESDPEARSLAAAVLAETELGVVECDSAAQALATLQHRAEETAFLFADENLGGNRDGFELAEVVARLWPGIAVVITAERAGEEWSFPAGVKVLKKPWRELDVLLEAERSVATSPAKRLGA